MDLGEIWGTRDAICPKNIVEAGTSSETSQLEMGDDSISEWGPDSKTAQNTSGSVLGIPSPQGSAPTATNEESGENETDNADESMPLSSNPFSSSRRRKAARSKEQENNDENVGPSTGKKKKANKKKRGPAPGAEEGLYGELIKAQLESLKSR